MVEKIRQPIVTVLGHVDHGKTTLLDYIRKTSVAKKEAGKITQDIGATNIPISIIFEIAKEYLEPIKYKIKISGLLFIDTPGHLAFTTMREKGGAIADLAVLVIDINEGIKPQTEESLEILKKFKTPFVVALTKIDKIFNWKTYYKDFIKNFENQSEIAKKEFEEKFYNIIAQLSNYNFNAELFSYIKDFTKEVAVVPCSGITGEGISNLFAVLVGLSQKFLINQLELSGSGKGVILEISKKKMSSFLSITFTDFYKLEMNFLPF
ncbi:MAG TPA: GTP-binding protein [Candidatus Aenigmarchaeota archaeon]|nr:GTP-binding protein [Candidatus Aenigmarchaeota archaeon]